MPDRNDLFPSQPPLLTGIEARRALQHLATHRLTVGVHDGAQRREQLSTVAAGADAPGRNVIVLEHDGGAPAFPEGAALELEWSEGGIRYGARARVRRLRAGDPPRYEIEVQPELRRLERRKARRVPVEPDDGVRAELRLEGHAAPLTATLADLSADGCRLALAAADARAAGVAAGAELEVTLALPDGGAARQSRLRLLRLERADERVQEYGAAWVAPGDAFTDRIARFVAIKQHALQHRRAAR